MLLKILSDIEARKEGEKTIVFSQFTGFLDILEPFLKAHGVRFVRYDGSMKNDKRQESLETIKTSATVRVILISFKAGSTGLNLTCCNNVVLMDLWWNPALEDQAFDRAHRLGQQRDVNIFKLIVEETVEDRILTLQNAKRELAKAALSGDAAGNFTKLTMADMLSMSFSHSVTFILVKCAALKTLQIFSNRTVRTTTRMMTMTVIERALCQIKIPVLLCPSILLYSYCI